jgi:hypothetical protein
MLQCLLPTTVPIIFYGIENNLTYDIVIHRTPAGVLNSRFTVKLGTYRRESRTWSEW